MDFSQELNKPVGFSPEGRMVTLQEVLSWPRSRLVSALDKSDKLSQKRHIICDKNAAAQPAKPKTRHALREGQFAEVPDHEVDYELTSPAKFAGSHFNLIPLQSAMQGTRGFYGARFANQALPLVHAEAPLVQNLDPEDPEGRSFDDKLGEFCGAIKARQDGVVHHLDGHKLQVQYADGKVEEHNLYHHFPFNRKTSLHHTALVKLGDKIKAGQLLAKSNYTDEHGTLAMGLNARIGLVPYHGRSMDDAVVISEDFAKRLTSEHLYGHDLDYKRGVKGGKAHYTGLFPHEFINTQLDKLDDDGVVKVGQIVHPGDPLILATKPRVVSSSSAQLGLLSKHMKNARSKAVTLWDHDTPGQVVDVKKLRSGVKVNISTQVPTSEGDKLVLRSGQKGVVAHIVPQAQMPRTADGKPLEVLLNPLGIPSRVNNSLVYELLLGKAAQATGRPYRIPSFNKPQEKWYDSVKAELDKAGLPITEEVFDPALNRKLENPITVGNGYILKLHHTAASKLSTRGQGSYSNENIPSHGGGEGAQSKRYSGLEMNATLSSGAYNLIREGATLRGIRCFDEKTEVLTRRGWLFWKDVNSKDLFYTQDGKGNGFFKRALKLHQYPYAGEMFGFEGRYLDWLVTPNHRLWMQHLKSPKLHFKTAEELHGRTFYVPQFGAIYPGNMSEDFRVAIASQPGWRSAGFSMGISDYCELLGWWLSEGCSHIEKGRGKRGITHISQSATANPEKLAEIVALCERLGLSYSCCPYKGPVTYVRIRNKPLAAHLRQFGTNAKDKRIPPVIFDAPLAARQKCLRAYILGDGHKQKKGNCTSSRASSASIHLIDDMQRLAVLSGNGGIVTELKGGFSKTLRKPMADGHTIKPRGPAWYIGFADNRKKATVDGWHPSSKFRHAYKVGYAGQVYCATISTGLLYVRRNGKPMWSGNSDDYWRQLRQGYEPREPGVPFTFDKFKALLTGSGYLMKHLPSGKDRLQFFTDKDLAAHHPIEVKSGDILNLGTMEPAKDGLFSPPITGGQSWGYIKLPHPVPNPAAETMILKLLGLTEKQFRSILAGEAELPAHLQAPRSPQSVPK